MINDEPEPRVNSKIIGITGGIGSGKSTVSRFIEEAGYPVYSSDVRAKSIVNENEALREQITALLGENAYGKNGLYNHTYVSEIVFADKGKLEQLNALIHPAVRTDFTDWVARQDSEYVFKETALLFELKLHESCFRSLLVTADDNCRLKRVMDRDGKTYREVESVMMQQMPEKDKIRLADYIIYNNGGVEELKAETLKFLSELKSL